MSEAKLLKDDKAVSTRLSKPEVTASHLYFSFLTRSGDIYLHVPTKVPHICMDASRLEEMPKSESCSDITTESTIVTRELPSLVQPD
jgi:uncharacterized RmlC-like cupin family protein